MFFNNKCLFLISLLIVAILSIGAISATDTNDTIINQYVDEISGESVILADSSNDLVSINNENNDILSAAPTVTLTIDGYSGSTLEIPKGTSLTFQASVSDKGSGEKVRMHIMGGDDDNHHENFYTGSGYTYTFNTINSYTAYCTYSYGVLGLGSAQSNQFKIVVTDVLKDNVDVTLTSRNFTTSSYTVNMGQKLFFDVSTSPALSESGVYYKIWLNDNKQDTVLPIRSDGTGSFSWTPNNLGNYSLFVRTYNSTNYYSGTSNTLFISVVDVIKENTDLTLTPRGYSGDSFSAAFGDKLYFDITTNPIVNDGNAYYKINYNGDELDKTFSLNSDGTGAFSWTPSSVKNYTVYVTLYNSSNYYDVSSNPVHVSVLEKTTISIETNATHVQYGDVIKFMPTVLDSSGNKITDGNITYYIDGKEWVSTVANRNLLGTMKLDGTHNFTVRYLGHGIYAPSELASVIITIGKYDAIFNVTIPNVNYPEKPVVTIKTNAKGNYSVKINDDIQYIHIDGDSGSLTLDLGIGDYVANITFNGSDSYNSDFKLVSFSVLKENAEFSVLASNDTLNYGDELYLISFTMASDASGSVDYYVDGKYNITSSLLEDVIISGFSIGTHTILADYSGDDKYSNASFCLTVTVNKGEDKRADSGFMIISNLNEDNSIDYDEELILMSVAFLGWDATGSVYYCLDGNYYNTTSYGEELHISDLSYGSHTIAANYSGDDKYKPAVYALEFKVVADRIATNIQLLINGSKNNIQIDKGEFLQFENIITPYPGEVRIRLYESSVDTGINAWYANDYLLKPFYDDGVYYFTAVFEGNDGYLRSSSNTIKVTVGNPVGLNTSSMIIYYDTLNPEMYPGGSPYVGEEVTIIGAILDSEGRAIFSKGNITYWDNGEFLYFKDLKITHLPNIYVTYDKPGIHNISAKFSGVEGEYEPCEGWVVFEIIRNKVNLSITVEDVSYPNKAVVNLTTNAFGNYTIYIQDKAYEVEIADELSKLVATDIFDVKNGYNAIALFNVTDMYDSASASTTFNVLKSDSSNFKINSDTLNINVGDNVVIHSSLDDYAIGTVVYKEYGGDTNLGSVNIGDTFTYNGFGEGYHTIIATYLGDDNHDEISRNITIHVSQNQLIETKLELTVNGVNEAKIDVGGNVTFFNSLHPINDDYRVRLYINGQDSGINAWYSNDYLIKYFHDEGIYECVAVFNGANQYKSASSNSVTVIVGNAEKPIILNTTLTLSSDKNNVSPNTLVKITPTVIDENNNVVDEGIVVFYDENNNQLAVGVLELTVAKNTTITAKYNGISNKYSESESSIQIIVKLNNPEINIKIDDVTYPAAPIAIITTNAYGNYSIEVSNSKYDFEFKEGETTKEITLDVLPVGGWKATLNYLGNDLFVSKELSTNFKVNEAEDITFKVFVSPQLVAYGNPVTFKSTFTDDATGSVTYSEGEDVLGVSKIGESLILTNLGVGLHNILAIYSGDSNYDSAIDIISVTILPGDFEFAISSNKYTINYGDEVILSSNLPSDAEGIVLFTTYDGKSLGSIKAGETLSVNNLSNGNIKIIGSYSGDSNYDKANSTVNVLVNKANINGDLSVNNVTYPENVTIKVTSLIDGNYVISIANRNYNISVKNGQAILNIQLDGGSYTVELTGPNNSNYNNLNINKNFNVKKETVDLVISGIKNITLGESLDLESNLDNVVFIFDDSDNVTAKSTEYTPLTSGIHNITVVYKGDKNHEGASVTYTFNVGDSMIIEAPDVVKYFKGPERFVVIIKDKNNNPLANQSVNITINGNSYKRISDNDGSTSIPLGLNSGEYNVSVEVDNTKINGNVKILATVNANDIVKVYRNDTQYYATFVDSQGNRLAGGTEVSFNINGVYYKRAIDENGQAKLNINLEQGKYVLTAINPETGEMYTNLITIIPRIIENHDLIKFYRNDSQYVVKVLGDDGNPAKAGEEVLFNINGVFYYRTTNDTGHVKLNLNLQPGDYIITAEYKNCRVSNNIKIKSVLSAGDITMRYRDGTKFEVKLVDGRGNPYSNQNITFNINGVFYNRLSDDNGHAQLSINLQKGEYIITSTYNQASISNKVTIY